MGCEFCGGGPLTAEHVIPRWVSDVMLDGEGMTAIEYTHGIQWRARKEINVTTRAFCEECNSRFLGGIEGATKPILAPIITPPGVMPTLQRQDLEQIATWAFKTALTGDPRSCRPTPEGYTERRIPPPVYHAFHRDRRPPDDVRIWLSARDPGGNPVRWSRITLSLPVITPPVQQEDGILLNVMPDWRPTWLTTVSLGPLVLRVAGLFDHHGSLMIKRSDGIGVIWPDPPEQLAWPIDRMAMNQDQIGRFEDGADLHVRV